MPNAGRRLRHEPEEVRPQVADAGGDEHRIAHEVEGEPSRVLDGDAFRLSVQIEAVHRVAVDVGLGAQSIELRIRVAIVIELRRRRQEKAEEVLRIEVVGVPAEQGHLQPILVAPLEERAPLQSPRRDGHPEILPPGGGRRLAGETGLRGSRTVGELERRHVSAPGVSRRHEERLRLLEIVRHPLVIGLIARNAGGDEAVRDGLAREVVVHDLRAVQREREGAPDPNVLERRVAALVEEEIVDRGSRLEAQLGLEARVRLDPGQIAVG